MDTFTHFVLTRFNVQTAVTGSRTPTSRQWLLPRLELFERYCLPSMRSQMAPYTWLVFLHADTPSDLRARIAQYDAFTPIWIDGVCTDDTIRDHVRRHLPEQVSHLITTRLDNDDAISADFLRRLQSEFAGQQSLFLNFPLGYQLQGGRLYLAAEFSNPFITYIERLDRNRDGTPFATVFQGGHDLLGQHARIRQIWTQPTWLQVLHSDNVLNRRRGVRRPASSNPTGFPDLPLITESRMRRAADVAVSSRDLASLLGHAVVRRARARLA